MSVLFVVLCRMSVSSADITPPFLLTMVCREGGVMSGDAGEVCFIFDDIYLIIMALPKSPQCLQTGYFPEAIWTEIGANHEWLHQKLFTIDHCSVS